MSRTLLQRLRSFEYLSLEHVCVEAADLLEHQARVYKSCCKDREVLLNLANKDRQRIEELEAKLIRANYLIDELEGHEGAEGWSEYLRVALAERNKDE